MSNPWAAIEKPTNDFNVRLVSKEHSARLYWGVDSRGRYLFLVDAHVAALPEKTALPSLSGIAVAIAHQPPRGKLVLMLNETANWELFHSLCSDLCRSTLSVQDEALAVAVVLRRLQRWQEFLRKARTGVLAIDEIKGLIGELLFLINPVASQFGWDAAVTFWKGPEGAPQDFAILHTTVEVKCQSGSSKPFVRITSIDQMSPQLPNGYLVVHTLATAAPETTGSITLPSLVESVRSAIVPCSTSTRERFEDLLHLAGYVYSEQYDTHVFERVATRSFRIADEFPRLRRSDIPSGIDNVSYTLSLDACAAFATEIEF